MIHAEVRCLRTLVLRRCSSAFAWAIQCHSARPQPVLGPAFWTPVHPPATALPCMYGWQRAVTAATAYVGTTRRTPWARGWARFVALQPCNRGALRPYAQHDARPPARTCTAGPPHAEPGEPQSPVPGAWVSRHFCEKSMTSTCLFFCPTLPFVFCFSCHFRVVLVFRALPL